MTKEDLLDMAKLSYKTGMIAGVKISIEMLTEFMEKAKKDLEPILPSEQTTTRKED